jgi:hypothetical protein
VLLLGLAACSDGSPGSQSVGKIASVTYQQDQAVPTFDASPHTVTASGRLEALRSVLQKDGWAPRTKTVDSGPVGCTGGTSTDLRITFSNGAKSTISVYECGTGNDRLTTDLTSLVDSWR